MGKKDTKAKEPEAPPPPPVVEEEATGKVESKSDAKKDFVPSKGLTTEGERSAKRGVGGESSEITRSEHVVLIRQAWTAPPRLMEALASQLNAWALVGVFWGPVRPAPTPSPRPNPFAKPTCRNACAAFQTLLTLPHQTLPLRRG